jgi:hypothetical protein
MSGGRLEEIDRYRVVIDDYEDCLLSLNSRRYL